MNRLMTYFLLVLCLGGSAHSEIVYSTYYANGPNHTFVTNTWKELDAVSDGWWAMDADNGLYASGWGGQGSNLVADLNETVVNFSAINSRTAYAITAEGSTYYINGPNRRLVSTNWTQIDVPESGGGWWAMDSNGDLFASGWGGQGSNLTTALPTITSFTAIDDRLAYAITADGDTYFLNGPNHRYITNTWRELQAVGSGWWGQGFDGNLYASGWGGQGSNLTVGVTETIVDFAIIDDRRAYYITASGTAVPEPSSVSLLMIAFGGLLLARKKYNS